MINHGLLAEVHARQSEQRELLKRKIEQLELEISVLHSTMADGSLDPYLGAPTYFDLVPHYVPKRSNSAIEDIEAKLQDQTTISMMDGNPELDDPGTWWATPSPDLARPHVDTLSAMGDT